MECLTNNIKENKKILKKVLPLDKSFDIISRDIKVGSRNAFMVMVDGFAKDDIMLWIMERLQSINDREIESNTITELLKSKIAYVEVDTSKHIDKIVQMVLSGAIAFIIDGESDGIIIDAREYPVRASEEPDLEKVTRGSRDGLVETIIFNTALIRRRIRDPKLVFNLKTVGKRSKTDVAIAYIEDLVDNKLLKEIQDKIDNIKVGSLIMGEKTLEEILIKKKWYNPFPLARFTERPDVVASHLMEGHIAIIVDTSPSVMILPVTIFHFMQHAEDYYQTPIVGTYIRWVRFLAMLSSFILLPLWLLLVYNKASLPSYLQFLGPKESSEIPLFIQFIILEYGLDLLRISSIHTPNALSSSLGIIGGLIVSEFAVRIGMFVPETVVYAAMAGIGTFATPSIEFGMAIRIFRLLLLILTGLFRNIGFTLGVLITIIMAYNTKPFKNAKRYTWPLVPFDGKALLHILFRTPIPKIGNNKD